MKTAIISGVTAKTVLTLQNFCSSIRLKTDISVSGADNVLLKMIGK